MAALPLVAGFAPFSSPTDRGSEAYRAGRYDEAASAYRKAVDGNPKEAVPHYNLGDAYYKKGDYEGALTEYRRALAFDPKMAEAYYNAGDCLYRLGRYEEALKAYRQADSLKKGDADTGFNIKLVLKRLAQLSKKKSGPSFGRQGGKGRGGTDGKGAGGQEESGPPGGYGQGQGSGPPMSDADIRALLARQSREEKALRNYFRPGKEAGQGGREAEIEQRLRGFGMTGMTPRAARPGQPYVERDW